MDEIEDTQDLNEASLRPRTKETFPWRYKGGTGPGTTGARAGAGRVPGSTVTPRAPSKGIRVSPPVRPLRPIAGRQTSPVVRTPKFKASTGPSTGPVTSPAAPRLRASPGAPVTRPMRPAKGVGGAGSYYSRSGQAATGKRAGHAPGYRPPRRQYGANPIKGRSVYKVAESAPTNIAELTESGAFSTQPLVEYNPNHDPKTGRFTGKGGGSGMSGGPPGGKGPKRGPKGPGINSGQGGQVAGRRLRHERAAAAANTGRRAGTVALGTRPRKSTRSAGMIRNYIGQQRGALRNAAGEGNATRKAMWMGVARSAGAITGRRMRGAGVPKAIRRNHVASHKVNLYDHNRRNRAGIKTASGRRQNAEYAAASMNFHKGLLKGDRHARNFARSESRQLGLRRMPRNPYQRRTPGQGYRS